MAGKFNDVSSLPHALELFEKVQHPCQEAVDLTGAHSSANNASSLDSRPQVLFDDRGHHEDCAL